MLKRKDRAVINPVMDDREEIPLLIQFQQEKDTSATKENAQSHARIRFPQQVSRDEREHEAQQGGNEMKRAK